MKKNLFLALWIGFLIQSCATKKDILYFSDIESNLGAFVREEPLVQVNDILNISVSTPTPEAAIPYNNSSTGGGNQAVSVQLLALRGYLVSIGGNIEFPVLGTIEVANKSLRQIEQELKSKLEQGGHLINPIVTVRVINAKVTVLGEVRSPGTYTFTEQFLSIPQTLGLAGDLTITGDRREILLIRESQGKRTIKKINLTESTWMNDPELQIRQNDVLVVNPNTQKVKTAGLIGNVGTLSSVFSILLSTIILLTR
jgi:polysaccharide export outer membrane protein